MSTAAAAIAYKLQVRATAADRWRDATAADGLRVPNRFATRLRALETARADLNGDLNPQTVQTVHAD